MNNCYNCNCLFSIVQNIFLEKDKMMDAVQSFFSIYKNRTKKNKRKQSKERERECVCERGIIHHVKQTVNKTFNQLIPQKGILTMDYWL